jgi:hypothetical protein
MIIDYFVGLEFLRPAIIAMALGLGTKSREGYCGGIPKRRDQMVAVCDRDGVVRHLASFHSYHVASSV